MYSLTETINWLLKGEPYIEYRTRIDLLGENEDTPEVSAAKKKTIEDPKIQQLIAELKNWPGTILNSHKSASQPFHKLSFIAEIGLNKNDSNISLVAEKIFEHQSDEGPFQLPANIPKHFGGSGQDTWAWALCDAPTVIYALAKLGFSNETRVKKATNYLANLACENGWHCTVSKELGKFRGPGKKEDPCPYTTLVMLKMLSQFEEWRESKIAHDGAECLLNLWQNSLKLHPYIFYMGTDFRKLKAPFIWYDVLHVFDVLSQFNWLKADTRLQDISSLIKTKAESEGKFTAESEWQAWRGWEFAQKKQPSRWLTFLVLRALKRTTS
jgi:hypothetical protein